jgi:hypothetical protein
MSHDRGWHTKRLRRDCAGRGRWLWRLVRPGSDPEPEFEGEGSDRILRTDQSLRGWLWRLVRRRSGSEDGRSQRPSLGCGNARRRLGSRKNETHREVFPQKVRLPDEAGGRRRSASEAAGFRPEPRDGLEAKTRTCRTARSSGALVALLVRYRIYIGLLSHYLRAELPVSHRYFVERQR